MAQARHSKDCSDYVGKYTCKVTGGRTLIDGAVLAESFQYLLCLAVAAQFKDEIRAHGEVAHQLMPRFGIEGLVEVLERLRCALS